MRKSWTVAGAVLTAVLVFGSIGSPVRVLRILDTAGGVVLCQRITAGEPWQLVFTHSMYSGNVVETWFPGSDNTMIRTDVRTDNAAAAEYYATDGNVTREDGQFVVAVTPLQTEHVTIRVDQVGKQRLRIGDRQFALITPGQESFAATIAVQSRPLIAQLAGDLQIGSRCG